MSRSALKRARQNAGMTQQQIADQLELSLRYYQSIEQGNRTGDFELWDSLEVLLGVHQRILRKNHDEGEKESLEDGKKLSYTETKTKCPFCGGENNARIYEDHENKEFFVYCRKCGIETKDFFSSKTEAVNAFLEGMTKKI